MAKPKNSFEAMAAKASNRLSKVRAAGEQLALLPDEAGRTPQQVADRGVGRPKGAQNKGSSQMRDWLASRGYRMPEDVLAQMAGMAQTGDAMLVAMENTERVLAWAYDGSKDKDGNALMPTASQRMAAFLQIYAIQLRAADALLPYGAAKATPDVAVQQNVQINVASAPTGDQARVVSPKNGRRMVPADAAYKTKQNQYVTDLENQESDGNSRTE